MTSYPLGIYNRWLRAVFIYIVPVAFVNYPTALFLLERTDPFGMPAALAWAAPLVAALFFLVALGIWQIGVTKYASTGSEQHAASFSTVELVQDPFVLGRVIGEACVPIIPQHEPDTLLVDPRQRAGNGP